MLYVYPFAQLHPATFARCTRRPHSITFWHDGEIVGSTKLIADQPGNITLDLPADSILELDEGTAGFYVTEELVSGNPPVLEVRGEFKRF